MRTPSRALPAWPNGFDDARGNFAAALLALSLTTLSDDFLAPFLIFAALDFAFATFFMAVFRIAIDFLPVPLIFIYLLRTTLCGLRLPMRPLSVPAAGSITALMSVGLPESIALFTARLSSSGVVTCAPTPPNASMILS